MEILSLERTERVILKPSRVLNDLCFKTKNIFNLGNYHIRQEYIKNGKWIRYNDLYKLLKDTEVYEELPTH